jgi:hypothetical protein
MDDAAASAEQERRKKLLNQRVNLARTGIQAFHRRDQRTAIKCFLTYLKILEDWKGVEHGGLTPQHFDLSKDVTELLMISGVYWDLCKIYDRVAVENQEFHDFMRKYIQFSKGMPFQSVCAESLRKYVSKQRPKHLNEFKAAYKILGTTRCFIATSLVDVMSPETLFPLRSFRDRVLKQTQWGRIFIMWYYGHGPLLADQVDRLPRWLRKTIARCLDAFAIIYSFLEHRFY